MEFISKLIFKLCFSIIGFMVITLVLDIDIISFISDFERGMNLLEKSSSLISSGL